MDIYRISLLGIIQGITEFLPISSSGHLAITSKLMNLNDNALLVAVILHAGSLFSIIAVYYKEIIDLLTKNKMMLPKIFLAIIPIGFVGFLFEMFHLGDLLFENMFVVAGGLYLTAFLLFFGMKSSDNNSIEFQNISYKDAFIIGLMQCIAILPGVSRSGTTISTALKLKIKREAAAAFSFMIALPVIAAACLLKLSMYIYHLHKHQIPEEQMIASSILFTGFIVSAITGFISLKFLIFTIKKGKLNAFAFYCAILATIIIVWKLCSA